MLGQSRMLGRGRILGISGGLAAMVAVFVVLTGVGAAFPTCTLFWTGKAGTSDWATKGNWSTTDGGAAATRIPASTDAVCMSTAPTSSSVVLGGATTSTIVGINWPSTATVHPSLEVDGSLKLSNTTAGSTLNQLTLSGTLLGPAPLTVSGAATLNTATLGKASTAGSGTHLILQGTTTANAPSLVFDAGSQLENQGTMNLADNANFIAGDSNAGNKLVNDAGATVSYIGSGPAQNAFIQVLAPNAGTVSVGVGTLNYGGGSATASDAGTFTAASGAQLNLQGTRTEATGASIAGAGVVDLVGGSTTTFNSGSSVTNTGRFQLDGTASVASAANVSVSNLTLNGTLDGPGTLTVTGAATLGNSSVLGVANTPTSAAHLILQGTTTANADAMFFQGGSELENQGTMNLADNADFVDNDGATGNELVNDSGGTISYTGSTAAQEAFIQVLAPNAGTVSVGKGTLVDGNGSHTANDSGTFTAASGATLDVNGNRVEGSGATLAGAGTVDVQSGFTVTFNSGSQVTNMGTFQVDGTAVVSSGVSLSAPNLTLNGSLEGTGTLTVTGAATLGNGSVLGVANDATTAAHLILQGTTTANADALFFQGGSELENQGTMNLADNADFVNNDGATGNELVNDAGATIAYVGSTSAQDAFIQVLAPNAGTVTVGKGTLFDGNGSQTASDSGTFTAASGATLDVNGNRVEGSGATLAGAGTVDVQSGFTVTFNSGSQVTNTGTFQVDGTAIVSSGVSLSAPNLTLNGTLEGTGTLTVTGASTLGNSSVLGVANDPTTAAHLILQGTTTGNADALFFQGGSELENQGTLNLKDNADLVNNDGAAGNELVNDSGGTVSYTGSTTTQNAFVQLPLTNNGTVSAGKGILNLSNLTNLDGSGNLTGGTYNAVGGTLAIPTAITNNAATINLGVSPSKITAGGVSALTSLTASSGSLDLGQSLTTTGAFANSGTLTIESPATFKGVPFTQSAGTTTVANGATLTSSTVTSPIAISGGTLTGNGTIKGALQGAGNVTPIGTTVAGPMTVSANYDNSAGKLTIPVSGTTTAGTDFGQLSATGSATLGGTLAIQTANGFTPPVGTQYTILNAASISGTFGTITGNKLTDRQYLVSYNPTSVVLTVQWLPATVTGVSPQQGPASGGTTVTITGSNFTPTTGVSFGGTPATSFTVTDDSHITATAPAGTGTVDVTVTNPGGTSSTSSADQFNYVPAPTVSAISPTTGPAAGGTSVTITGTNFTGASAVKFGATAATSFTVTDDSHISATAPAGTGTVDVTVTTVGGTSSTSAADQYTYQSGLPPTVTAVKPGAGPTAGGTKVTITGTNFVAPASVNFGSNPGTNVIVVSKTSITAIAPAGSAGSVDVTVTTPAGASAVNPKKDLYAYGPPHVTSFTPSSGITGSTVTITGSGFSGGDKVTFGTLASKSVTIVSGTSLKATVPNGDATPSTITVTSVQGSSTSVNQFTPTFAITSFSPTSGPAGTVVTINGIGFTSTSTVKFHGVAGTNIVHVSSTQLQATVPATATTGNITVTNTVAPKGTVTSPTAYTVG